MARHLGVPFVDLNVHSVRALLAARRGVAHDDNATSRALLGRSITLLDGGDISVQYGPWQTVYGLFRRWQRDGTWARVLTGLQALADVAGLITWDVSVELHHRPGAPARGRSAQKGDLQKEPPGGLGGVEPADHALGRSRGGWTTKLHLGCEQGASRCRS
jgi:hypothetical protein